MPEIPACLTNVTEKRTLSRYSHRDRAGCPASAGDGTARFGSRARRGPGRSGGWRHGRDRRQVRRNGVSHPDLGHGRDTTPGYALTTAVADAGPYQVSPEKATLNVVFTRIT
jgi:hypothetical protein